MRRTSLSILLSFALSFALPCLATADHVEGVSRQDPFDLSMGTVIVAHDASVLPENVFSDNPDTSTFPEAGDLHTIMGTTGKGTSSFIEFETAAPVVLTGVRLFAEGLAVVDPITTNLAHFWVMDRFLLRADSDENGSFETLVIDAAVDPIYSQQPGNAITEPGSFALDLTIRADETVKARRWRFEIVSGNTIENEQILSLLRSAVPFADGVRVLELDALGSFEASPGPELGTLNGTYRIQTRGNDRFWHEDGSGDLLVSTRSQPNDAFTRFVFERQPDNSYRIRVLSRTGRDCDNRARNAGCYLHLDTSTDRVLSTRFQSDDDFTRFFLERGVDGAYRIRLKATGRYLRVDPNDQLVSTRSATSDDFSRFHLTSADDLAGVYRVRVKANSRVWHTDPADGIVSTRSQPEDDTVLFRLLREPEEDDYRIQDVESGLFLHADDQGDQLLSTRFQPDDDFARFFFEPRSDGSYNVRVRASGRYLHEDGTNDRLLSTRFQSDDDYTRFFLLAAGAGPCRRDARTACLIGGRFEVRVDTFDFSNPPAGPGLPVAGSIQTYGGVSSETDQSVSFYSFEDGNVEIFIKMVDACSFNQAFWLFAAGATTAEAKVTVRDMVTGETYEIENPRAEVFETVADTNAFETCN